MSTIANVTYGRLEGERRGRHLAFRGIPYARPPVGALRFAASVPPEPWTGVRAATQFGASAPQGAASAPGMLAEGPQSEDCLYLNVFTPALDVGKRPVLFWIHGGAFTLGSASQAVYDGGPLCERGDVVVVTINYRLGALGYLCPPEGTLASATANAGQLDQVAALRWVAANIAAFGGDSGNVTIFGESAGSMAVCALLAMPAAQGLFHRAIAESGALAEVSGAEAAAKVTAALLSVLGINAQDAERLRDVPAEDLVRAQRKAAAQSGVGLAFAPIVDETTLPQSPLSAFAAGEGAAVPLMIGTNRDELNLFTMGMLRDIDKPIEDSAAMSVLQRSVPRASIERLAAMLAIYRASRECRDLPHSARALLGAIQTDRTFRMPSIRFAEAYAARNPNVFMYLFTYESPAMHGALRACHALELPFVFGTLSAPFQDRFAGTGPDVERLSELMMDTWIAFARNGKPSHPALGDFIPYDSTRRATMVFDRKCTLEDAPYEDERVSWNGLW